MRMIEVQNCPEWNGGTIYFDLDDISLIVPEGEGSRVTLKTGNEIYIPVAPYDLAFQTRIVSRL
jgi:hypothetical protein